LSGQLRKGSLELLLADGDTWHACTVVLDEEHFWYSLPPSSESGSVGGGMASVALCDCDKVCAATGDDRRQFHISSKGELLTLRAKKESEQDAWVLAVVKQAALIKEREILMQADRILSNMEFKKSSQQCECAASFLRLAGVLGGPARARQLFLDFAVGEHAAATSAEASAAGGSSASGTPGVQGVGDSVLWPAGLALEELLASLPLGCPAAAHDATVAKALASRNGCRSGAVGAADVADIRVEVDGIGSGNAADGTATLQAAWAFAAGPLFDRFWEFPDVQCRLCQIAAGIA